MGDICSRFYDRDGNTVDFPGSERLIALELSALQDIPVGIAVAVGAEKVAPSSLPVRAAGIQSTCHRPNHRTTDTCGRVTSKGFAMPTASARPLDGKRALVTGASKGIGAQIAHALAQAGADVIVSGRSRCELTTLADRLRQVLPSAPRFSLADLALPDAPTQVAQESLAVFGGLDVLVNNAGISYPGCHRHHRTQVRRGSERQPPCAGLARPKIGSAMADAGGGAIVTVASAAALRALPEHYSYCIAKAGLVMATKVLALELGSRGVRANSVCPTVVLTEMGQTVWGEHDKAAPMLNSIRLGRFAMPDEVSEAVRLAGVGCRRHGERNRPSHRWRLLVS